MTPRGEPTTVAERQRKFRQAQRKAGRRRFEYFLTPAEKVLLDRYLEAIRPDAQK